VDASGNAYVTGSASSTNFPTLDPLQAAYGGGTSDAFVTKINPTGSALVYSTYLGGSDADWGHGIAVDSAGDAFVVGSTSSKDFPTVNPLQPTYGGGHGDAFVAEINPSGSALVYSTFLGGSNLDYGYGIAVDASGNAYVTGSTASTDFPTESPMQPANAGNTDVFVSKINPSGSALVYSTYLGGHRDDFGFGIALDSADDAYITGYTGSDNFPTKNPLQPANGSGTNYLANVFVTEINPAGSALVYSTYLGGTGADTGYGIAVDPLGNAYVAGTTQSDSFPVTPGAFQTTFSGCCGAFVSKINATGSALSYSTWLGPNGTSIYGIAVDSLGDAYVTGTTGSGFPTTPFAFQPQAGSAFVTKFNPSGSTLLYSSYLGGASTTSYGVAVDGSGNMHVTGGTGGGFLTVNPLQSTLAGNENAFVASLPIPEVTTTTLTTSVNPSAYRQLVKFTATVSPAGLGPFPGYIDFSNEAIELASLPVGPSGTVVFSTPNLPLGSNSITASFQPLYRIWGSLLAPQRR
jgi:hypothetical protein